jgi:Subtilase family
MMKVKISCVLLCILLVALFGEHILSFSRVYAWGTRGVSDVECSKSAPEGFCGSDPGISEGIKSVSDVECSKSAPEGFCGSNGGISEAFGLSGGEDTGEAFGSSDEGLTPDTITIVSGNQTSLKEVTNAQIAQEVYQNILDLPAEPQHKICPMYLVEGKTQLTFVKRGVPLSTVSVQKGGCSTVTLGQNDVRIADTDFLALFNSLVNHATQSVSGIPLGLSASDLQNAYRLPSSTAGKGQTVAIVDAYDDPNAEADMNVYRSKYGLPSCTTRDGCFQKVDELGSTHYPDAEQGWAEEIALDLDIVSAVCPNCHILLVEAKQASFSDLGSAVDTAVRLGAHIVNNSYGSPEDAQSVQAAARYYNHPGVIITASSGDFGSASGVQLPAAFNNVIAVGGTSLSPAPRNSQNQRGWIETAWDGAGGGCSKYINQPVWQKVEEGCSMRTVPDVAAVADPDTGVAVYNTYGGGAWEATGGTSASSAIIAGVYGLAGNAATIDGSYLHSHAANLYHVGSCAASASTTTPPIIANACQQLIGLETPNGIKAF